MKKLTITLLSLMIKSIAYAGPLINEISAGGSRDWIEITVTSDTESCDISKYLVTMYYGTNEKISSSPVTLKNRDIPETPYDDRFAVVHFTPYPIDDETDLTGDTNGNGILDLYCVNYGLWNTDCVVSIDNDDLHNNGGIADFIAFSNRDGSINSTIAGYINAASAAGEWETCSSSNIQECAVDIGVNGLNSYSTISRITGADTNTLNDFKVTPYATPGRENIINAQKGGRRLFRPESKKISHRHGNSRIIIPLFLLETCSIKVRIFNSTGFTIYSSELKENLSPGSFSFVIHYNSLRGKTMTGLYTVLIEASGKSSSSETANVFLVIAGKK